jgi:hypothetical protein
MVDCEALRMLGSPDVRNALLLNEIGVLTQDFGKLSAEFALRGRDFPHHLALRRLTRGQDPYLGPGASPLSALVRALDCGQPDGKGTLVEDIVRRKFGASAEGRGEPVRPFGQELEGILEEVRSEVGPQDQSAYERVAKLAREVWSDFAWQMKEEEAFAESEPPFVPVPQVLELLDQLPTIANVVEMLGRTWHPEGVLPPEVRQLRAVQKAVDRPASVVCAQDGESLYAVRKLFCEVLENQLLEINNIRKDGPGDLGSWFWRGRLYARREEGLAALRSFGRGDNLRDVQMESVVWLGLRIISEWAYGKVLLADADGSVRGSLWDQCRLRCALNKSGLAQAVIEGGWPQADRLSWQVLRVSLDHPDADSLEAARQVVEIDYPLGSELRRSSTEMEFTFPALQPEMAEPLLLALNAEVARLLGSDTAAVLSTSPLRLEGPGLPRVAALSTPW